MIAKGIAILFNVFQHSESPPNKIKNMDKYEIGEDELYKVSTNPISYIVEINQIVIEIESSVSEDLYFLSIKFAEGLVLVSHNPIIKAI